jgi:uncharacterized protein DUF222/HNH endonuclease
VFEQGAAGLEPLAEVVDDLATQDLKGLSDAARAERVRILRWLVDRLEGQWLRELAALDARGATAASSAVRTARALFRGPLNRTAQAVTAGELSVAHASALAHGTSALPTQTTAKAEPVPVAAARRLNPPRLRQVIAHLRSTVDPEGADRRHDQRWLWVAPTWEGMVALQGLLDPEAGQILLGALEPLARPHSAEDTRSGGQRRADALVELARRNLEGGQLPQTGGVRPQLTVIVDLDSLLSHPGQEALGGELGGMGPLSPEACRRLACDGAVTRVLVTRHPSSHPGHDPGGHHGHDDLGREGGLADRLQAAMAQLPPILGGAPSQPLNVGRASRVVTPAQRSALAVRDGGCVFPDRQRPLAWCEGHHLVPWLDGGPTDLANLALLCRAHHRAIHEGGWQLTRGPDGRCTATPPHRQPHPADDIAPSPEPAAEPPTVPGERMGPSTPWPSCRASAWGRGSKGHHAR